jgi:hypothetical protein
VQGNFSVINPSPSGYHLVISYALALLWRQHVPPKHWLTFNRLYDILSQMTKLFITTTVRTLNPTLMTVVVPCEEFTDDLTDTIFTTFCPHGSVS